MFIRIANVRPTSRLEDALSRSMVGDVRAGPSDSEVRKSTIRSSFGRSEESGEADQTDCDETCWARYSGQIDSWPISVSPVPRSFDVCARYGRLM
jgi:hypothetical protein